MRALAALMLVAACGDASIDQIESFAVAPVVLENGSAVTGLFGSARQEHHFQLDVPEGASNLSFSIEGGQGDADLYVRFAAPPSVTTYDHRPYLATSREAVNVPSATSGRWFVMVRAYRAYSGLTLIARYDLLQSRPITNGATFSLAASRGVEQHFHLEVPQGAAGLHVAIAGGTGDADLYLRFASAPTRTEYDFRPYRSNSNEAIEPPQAHAGVWHLMVRGYSDYSDVLLEVSFTWDETSRRAFEDRVLALTNEHRASGALCGAVSYPPAPPLAMNETLRAAARLHSADMADRGYFDHTSPDGETFDARLRRAGYGGRSPWGENIAAGQLTPEDVVAGWIDSPHHCENIMNASFRVLGVGYGFGRGSPYRHYWTQDFGG